MDSLTQIVLGAAVGEAVLGSKVGNKAMLYGAIAGTLPDLDVLSGYFTDTVTAIEWHRGLSHSLFFSLLFAPVLGWLIAKVEKKTGVGWKEWTLLLFLGLFTHPILDAFTTWGTQLFWPLETRLAFQTIFVIDPLYTLPFLFFLILAMREKRTSPKRRKFNTLGMLVSSAYLMLTVILKGLAYTHFVDQLKLQEIAYEQISVRPTPFNTMLWTANIDVGDAYLVGNYSFFDSKAIRFTTYPKNHQLLGDLVTKDKVKRLINITEGWYTITQKGNSLYFNDLRFGLLSLEPKETRFAFSYELIEVQDDLQVKETPKRRPDAKKLLAALWSRMWGN
jgi:inner membrane protein